MTLSVHRHGPYTDVVAATDRLRTSRLDYESPEVPQPPPVRARRQRRSRFRRAQLRKQRPWIPSKSSGSLRSSSRPSPPRGSSHRRRCRRRPSRCCDAATTSCWPRGRAPGRSWRGARLSWSASTWRPTRPQALVLTATAEARSSVWRSRSSDWRAATGHTVAALGVPVGPARTRPVPLRHACVDVLRRGPRRRGATSTPSEPLVVDQADRVGAPGRPRHGGGGPGLPAAGRPAGRDVAPGHRRASTTSSSGTRVGRSAVPQPAAAADAASSSPDRGHLKYRVVGEPKDEGILDIVAEILADDARHVLLYCRSEDRAADVGDYLTLHGFAAGAPGDASVPGVAGRAGAGEPGRGGGGRGRGGPQLRRARRTRFPGPPPRPQGGGRRARPSPGDGAPEGRGPTHGLQGQAVPAAPAACQDEASALPRADRPGHRERGRRRPTCCCWSPSSSGTTRPRWRPQQQRCCAGSAAASHPQPAPSERTPGRPRRSDGLGEALPERRRAGRPHAPRICWAPSPERPASRGRRWARSTSARATRWSRCRSPWPRKVIDGPQRHHDPWTGGARRLRSPARARRPGPGVARRVAADLTAHRRALSQHLKTRRGRVAEATRPLRPPARISPRPAA